jgi:hypothetical protein
MINPNRVHRAKAIVVEFSKSRSSFKVRLTQNGALVEGFDLPKNVELGDLVNVQASYSIVLDRYIVKTVRKTASAKSKALRVA